MLSRNRVNMDQVIYYNLLLFYCDYLICHLFMCFMYLIMLILILANYSVVGKLHKNHSKTYIHINMWQVNELNQILMCIRLEINKKYAATQLEKFARLNS